uniref:Ubiquitin-like protease family profile domain-containing protein n=1 Tax=Eutreptiella gymnastica TaxID=73025 RepID=A0A7S4LF50_9EUGL
MPVWNLEVPQQDNGFDCGVFMLHFIELWFLGGFMQKFISAPMSLDHRSLFTADDIVSKRQFLIDLILELDVWLHQNPGKAPPSAFFAKQQVSGGIPSGHPARDIGSL